MVGDELHPRSVTEAPIAPLCTPRCVCTMASDGCIAPSAVCPSAQSVSDSLAPAYGASFVEGRFAPISLGNHAKVGMLAVDLHCDDGVWPSSNLPSLPIVDGLCHEVCGDCDSDDNLNVAELISLKVATCGNYRAAVAATITSRRGKAKACVTICGLMSGEAQLSSYNQCEGSTDFKTDS